MVAMSCAGRPSAKSLVTFVHDSPQYLYNGTENGSYCNILGLYWVYWGNIGVILGYVGVTLGLSWGTTGVILLCVNLPDSDFLVRLCFGEVLGIY